VDKLRNKNAYIGGRTPVFIFTNTRINTFSFSFTVLDDLEKDRLIA
jgi:hypothetical protein